MVTLRIQLLNLILQLKHCALRAEPQTIKLCNFINVRRIIINSLQLKIISLSNASICPPYIFLIVLWLRDFPANILLCEGETGQARGWEGEEGGKLWHQQVIISARLEGGGTRSEKPRRLIEGDRWLWQCDRYDITGHWPVYNAWDARLDNIRLETRKEAAIVLQLSVAGQEKRRAECEKIMEPPEETDLWWSRAQWYNSAQARPG